MLFAELSKIKESATQTNRAPSPSYRLEKNLHDLIVPFSSEDSAWGTLTPDSLPCTSVLMYARDLIYVGSRKSDEQRAYTLLDRS